MATKTISPLRRYGSESNLMKFPEASSQSFKAGQLVYLDTSGQVTVVADNGQVILGIAAQDASGTQATMIMVDVIKPGEFLVGNIYHATPASAVCADASFGDLAEVATSSNKTVVDIGATANAAFRIVNRVPEDSATDIYARVIFSVISTYCQCDTATVS